MYSILQYQNILEVLELKHYIGQIRFESILKDYYICDSSTLSGVAQVH